MSGDAAVILGVGAGNGASLARRFATAGCKVGVVSRSEERMQAMASPLPGARGYGCDVTDAAALHTTLERIATELGHIGTLIYNAGGGTRGTIDQITQADMTHTMAVNAFGLFTATQAVLPGMRALGRGNIIVIGAGAAHRGRAATTAFAAAKAAQFSLAQSLARTLGPEGIHVAYVTIDGVIDMPRQRANFPDRPDDFFLDPDAIAEAVFGLTIQDRSAWTFELDLRPYGETW